MKNVTPGRDPRRPTSAPSLSERTNATPPTYGDATRQLAIARRVEDWARRYDLTRVEWELLHDAIRGASRRVLAARRGISINTLKTHLRHLLRKTGDATLAHAVQRGLREIISSGTDGISRLGVMRAHLALTSPTHGARLSTSRLRITGASVTVRGPSPVRLAPAKPGVALVDRR